MFGRTFEETLDNLEQVFGKLQKAGLKLKAKKCSLFKKEVLFLGYKVSVKRIQTDPQKVSFIFSWPVPINASEVKSFLEYVATTEGLLRGFHQLLSLFSS